MFPKTLSLIVAAACSTAVAETREYELNNGLNYIGITIQPDDPEPAAVFAPVLDRVEFVAEYDSTSRVWHTFHPALAAPGQDTQSINTLTSIQPGRGYAVSIEPGDHLTLAISGAMPDLAPRQLPQGWNLVAFMNSKVDFWSDPVGEDRFKCSGLSTFDNQHTGFVLADPPFGYTSDSNGNGIEDPDEFDWLYEIEYGAAPLRTVVPGAAYWVRVNDPFILGPQLALWMESDSFDEENCALVEDINGDGLFDYGYSVWDGIDYAINECGWFVTATQDTIHFRVPGQAAVDDLPVLRQILTVANRGDRDGTAPYSGNDELRFEILLDDDLSSWLSVSPTQGTVSSAFDPQQVQLQASIQDLPVGFHSGVLTVNSTAGARQILVKIDVLPIGGTFEGSAVVEFGSTQPCEPGENGTPVLSTNRPLRMSIQDNVCTINSAFTRHLEEDMVLVFDGSGSSFTATGSITVAADSPVNPIGQEYTRTITMTGQRRSDDAETAGTLLPLQGCYVESISGLGPDLEWRGPFLVLQVTK